MNSGDLFEASLVYPDPDARRRLAELVGIDDQMMRLEKGLRLVLDRTAIEHWAQKQHGQSLPLVSYFQNRPPLFLLVGDVGTGKTALAENIGDAVARAEKISVTLHRLTLAARGSGLQGDASTLIAKAFAQIADLARKAKSPNSAKAKAGHILLVDEADALAQSREMAQMHHEDRAGVNSLIRGINTLAEAHLPAAVIMCTNRVEAIDPAVRRRAAEVLIFDRPGPIQREAILSRGLAGSGVTPEQISKLVAATGARAGEPSFTYSDLTQRLLPNIALDAYPDKPITGERALQVASTIKATPAFGAAGD